MGLLIVLRLPGWYVQRSCSGEHQTTQLSQTKLGAEKDHHLHIQDHPQSFTIDSR